MNLINIAINIILIYVFWTFLCPLTYLFSTSTLKLFLSPFLQYPYSPLPPPTLHLYLVSGRLSSFRILKDFVSSVLTKFRYQILWYCPFCFLCKRWYRFLYNCPYIFFNVLCLCPYCILYNCPYCCLYNCLYCFLYNCPYCFLYNCSYCFPLLSIW